MTLFTGLAAFPLTPTTPSGEIVEHDLRQLVRRIEESGADSIGLLGSTGTYMFLTRAERRRAIEVATSAAPDIPIIVGVGALRTDDVQAHARDAAAAGAAGLLLAPASYTPLTEEEVFQHFVAVASVTDLPICIYSNPDTTNFTFKPDFVARLATLPTVMAIKLPLPDDGDIASDLSLFRAAAPRLVIGYSGDWGCKDALLAGADCWYSVAAGLFPAPCVALTKAARASDAGEAERLDQRLDSLWDLFRTYGSLRVIYAAANLLGLTGAQPPRPILGLGDALTLRLKSALPL